ncbi:LacI family DNA-binding transcriptional regulator [Paenibacillus daejeonensis]|uniref:LacI family DNA-binding transcriptional regulator n=1 Tax=Paenibacillus daejeonensis TaxID=135193 RepID=UPI0003A2E75A|nr:substrate-binding domain-containing protein [Paenibacillus daejeonensis]
MPRKKAVTQKMLADSLGLSEYTVSKALRGLPGMSDETRAEVISVAKRLGYRTREQKQSFAAERINLHANYRRRFQIIMGRNTIINQLMMESLQERINSLGDYAEILLAPPMSSKSAFETWVEQHNVMYADGLFLNPGLPQETEQALISLKIPKILINYPLPESEIDSVIWDVYTPVYQAVTFLYQRGHDRIMFMGNIDQERGYKIRWNAFNDAMKACGLPVNQEFHAIYDLHKENLTKMISNKIIQVNPTAILCNMNIDLIYYIFHLIKRRIPEDCSLISTSLNVHTRYHQLTQYRFMLQDVAQRAVERILWRIANPQMPYEHIRIRAVLSEGESVRGYSQQNPN